MPESISGTDPAGQDPLEQALEGMLGAQGTQGGAPAPQPEQGQQPASGGDKGRFQQRIDQFRAQVGEVQDQLRGAQDQMLLKDQEIQKLQEQVQGVQTAQNQQASGVTPEELIKGITDRGKLDRAAQEALYNAITRGDAASFQAFFAAQDEQRSRDLKTLRDDIREEYQTGRAQEATQEDLRRRISDTFGKEALDPTSEIHKAADRKFVEILNRNGFRLKETVVDGKVVRRPEGKVPNDLYILAFDEAQREQLSGGVPWPDYVKQLQEQQRRAVAAQLPEGGPTATAPHPAATGQTLGEAVGDNKETWEALVDDLIQSRP